MGLKGWISLLFICPAFSWAQSTSPAWSAARMVVTVGHFELHDTRLPLPGELIVSHEAKPLPIARLIPLRGERAGLELFLVVDNCSSCEVGSKFDELRQFIRSQPETTAIGVAYIQDGCVRVAEEPTTDRERVVKALNPPSGSLPSSPFTALTELIQGWEPGAARRAVLLISNGVDPETKNGIDPAAEAAIEAAQRSGVTVYAIYHPRADWASSDNSVLYWGQILLAHVTYETGGQAYYLGFGPLPSLEPYLTDLADHFANQYLLEWPDGTGLGTGLQAVSVKTVVDDFDVLAPARIWIPEPRRRQEGNGR